MDRKLQIKVLRHGPDKSSEQELDIAAWLIRHDFADGEALPDMSRPGGHAYSVMWRGLTPAGESRLARLNLFARFLSSKVVTGIFIGVVVAVASMFIRHYLLEANQPQNQSGTPQTPAQKSNG